MAFTKTLEKQIIKWLLPKLLKKKRPKQVPRSGYAGKRVNCFYIYLGTEGDEKSTYLVTGYDPEKEEFKVLARDKKNLFTVEETISLDDFLNYLLRVTHFYGLYDLRYTNIYDLAFNQITKYAQLKVKLYIFWDAIAQWWFNKKSLKLKIE